jgi:hypothetical protein
MSLHRKQKTKWHFVKAFRCVWCPDINVLAVRKRHKRLSQDSGTAYKCWYYGPQFVHPYPDCYRNHNFTYLLELMTSL